jgi:HTH-type transcriptional regulator / antitoxin HipB
MHFTLQTPAQLPSQLRSLRKARGLSQADLGRLLGLSQSRVARIESGAAQVSVQTLMAVLAQLGARLAIDAADAQAPQARVSRSAKLDW